MSASKFDFTGLVEAVYECLQAQCLECKDPYDLYVNRIKAHVYQNTDGVKEKIELGYQSIIENLK